MGESSHKECLLLTSQTVQLCSLEVLPPARWPEVDLSESMATWPAGFGLALATGRH